MPNTEKELLRTPWFSVLGKPTAMGDTQYVIDAPDFVVIVATNPEGRLLLVRQFRPALDKITLEVPAGIVDPGETPEFTARKELVEETGHEAGALELIACLSPSTARFRNRMWCYFAPSAQPTPAAQGGVEPGMNAVVYEHSWRNLLNEPEFFAAPSSAALFAAVAKGKL